MRLYMAFDASAVSAAALGRGVGGHRVRGFARMGLPPGALVPSPSALNLARDGDVRAGVRRAVDAVAPRTARATLVLPDGLARLVLLDLPAGADPRDFVRFRLAGTLPWPPSEATFDALPARRGRVIGAAVRRAVVAEYEQAATLAGLEVEKVHLAPLLALDALQHRASGEAVHAVLGDVALSLAVFQDGGVVALRNRRRDRSPGEAARLCEEAARTARLAGDGESLRPLVFSGADAERLRLEAGTEPPPHPGLAGPAEWPEAAEAAWLGGLTA